MLCILTSFQVLHTTKAGQNTVLAVFNLFCFILYVFSDFSTENKKNNIWKKCFGYNLKIDSPKGYPILSFFWFIFSFLGIFLRYLAHIKHMILNDSRVVYWDNFSVNKPLEWLSSMLTARPRHSPGVES